MSHHLPPTGIITTISTVVSLATTVIFGVWGVLSYKAAVNGNRIASLALQQAVMQNQLALLSWCDGVKVRMERS